MSRTPLLQHTIQEPTSVEGVGYWNGREIRVEFRPAEPNSGVFFVRENSEDGRTVRIPAHVSYRVDTPRRSDLERDGVVIAMVEHALASLRGLEIDNCEIHVTETEMPGLDGSALPFVRAIQKAGRRPQDASLQILHIEKTIRVGDDDAWIEVEPVDDGLTHLAYLLDYGENNSIGRQCAELTLTPDAFVDSIARARTFLLQDEAEKLQRQGLGERTTFQELLVFGDDGPIDNELRFGNECARHKLLDMTGDLAMAGIRIAGRFTAFRSGHHLNAELVREILSSAQASGVRIEVAMDGVPVESLTSTSS